MVQDVANALGGFAIDKYVEYLSKLTEYKNDYRFQNFHNSVNQKVGYEVSAFRALELVMFRNAPYPSSFSNRALCPRYPPWCLSP